MLFYPEKRVVLSDRLAGCLAVMLVIAACSGVTWLSLHAVTFNRTVTSVLGVIISFYTLSARSLIGESSKVKKHLDTGDIPAARKALSMIVGRDTGRLDEAGIIRATVETVAESMTDGIVSPLFYLAVGGPVAAVVFKAVSTMDSMIAHKNRRYRHFGTCAAYCDDIMNFIPARITGFFLVPVAAIFSGNNGVRSLKIVLRDRLNHDSPNSAHSEAAIAGALGVRLGGGAWYQGEFIGRPFLGDDVTSVTSKIISRTNIIAVGVTVLSTLLIFGAEVIFSSGLL